MLLSFQATQEFLHDLADPDFRVCLLAFVSRDGSPHDIRVIFTMFLDIIL